MQLNTLDLSINEIVIDSNHATPGLKDFKNNLNEIWNGRLDLIKEKV